MAADRKGAGARKIDVDRLAGRLLFRVEAHAARGDIDLVEEFVLVRKEKGVAASNRDLAEAEGASLLNDSVRRGGAASSAATTSSRNTTVQPQRARNFAVNGGSNAYAWRNGERLILVACPL